MKNWKYIDGAKVGNESLAAHPDTKVAQEIYKTYLDAGKDENKTLEILAAKYKSIPRDDLKRHIKEAIEAYSKIVKNSKTGNAGITDKEFNSENDLRRWCIDHGYTYTPVGGGYYRLENDKPGSSRPDLEAHVTGNGKTVGNTAYDDGVKKGKEDKKAGRLITAAGFDMHVSGFSKYSFEEKEQFKKGYYSTNDLTKDDIYKRWKTGNANYRYKGYLITKSDEDGEIIVYKPNGRDVAFRGTKSESIAKDWVDHHEVGNEKTGAEGFFKQLSDDVKEREKKDDADIEKVGNKEYSTDDFKRIKEEALRIAQTTKDEEKKKRALKIADYMKYAHNQPDWGKIVDRYDAELKQIGNSASDDKFAYVMREFDEGKLKTPDGKVVTDPAQAKAIAYSESKKTENGLARARNAIKKS